MVKSALIFAIFRFGVSPKFREPFRPHFQRFNYNFLEVAYSPQVVED